jgi:hypothetical protein
MKNSSYKKLITDMLKAATPQGLSYAKILSTFKRQHPTQCRKVFIRQALAKSPFKLSRNKYVLVAKKKKRVAKKRVAAVAAAEPRARATVFDNSTVVAPLVPAVPGETVPHWQYNHDGWKNYDKAASDVVEAAYQEWKSNPYTDVRAIKSGEWQYAVDFTNMEQQNIQHENHTKRLIRRGMMLPVVTPTTPAAVTAGSADDQASVSQE